MYSGRVVQAPERCCCAFAQLHCMAAQLLTCVPVLVYSVNYVKLFAPLSIGAACGPVMQSTCAVCRGGAWRMAAIGHVGSPCQLMRTNAE